MKHTTECHRTQNVVKMLCIGGHASVLNVVGMNGYSTAMKILVLLSQSREQFDIERGYLVKKMNISRKILLSFVQYCMNWRYHTYQEYLQKNQL